MDTSTRFSAQSTEYKHRGQKPSMSNVITQVAKKKCFTGILNEARLVHLSSSMVKFLFDDFSQCPLNKLVKRV